MEDNEKAVNLSMTFSERIVAAITTGALMLVGGIALILLSPIFFFKALLTSKRTDWRILGGGLKDSFTKSLDDFGDKLDDMTDPDGDEDWKKDHKNQYGK